MSKPTQQEIWDAIAVQWNQYRRTMFDNTKTFIQHCKGNILDIGCGSGRNFLPTKNLEWYGIDFSKEMLTYAKQRAKELGMTIELQQASADNLPFNDEYFDNLLLITVLHCVETPKQREQTLKEAYRVLKHQGKMLISVWSSNNQRVNGRTGHIQVPWTVNKQKLLREQYVYTKEELTTLLEKTGFDILNTEEKDNITMTVQKP